MSISKIVLSFLAFFCCAFVHAEAVEKKLVVLTRQNHKVFVYEENSNLGKVFSYSPQGYLEKTVNVTHSGEGMIFENEDGVITVTPQSLTSETLSPDGFVAFFVKNVTPEVAKKCKAPENLVGLYYGEWAAGGYKSLFSIFSLNEECKAEIFYSGTFNRKVVIEGSVKNFLCNYDTSGKCRFSFKKDGSLKADYNNPAGGRNWADFKRVPSPLDLN